ncbi:MAG: TetR/AcrR family transcriptional regulator, partial [Pseudorhizobium sp.]
GLDQTSITAICNQAGLSTGAIYKHFSGKEQIITAALQFAAMDHAQVPHEWPLLRDDMAALRDQHGFDVATVARTNLHLLASSIKPGPLRNLLKPQMEQTISLLAERLAAMEQAGEIQLKMNPLRTAMCLAALAQGLSWLGLASGRELQEISVDIAAGLECLVEARPAASVRT